MVEVDGMDGMDGMDGVDGMDLMDLMGLMGLRGLMRLRGLMGLMGLADRRFLPGVAGPGRFRRHGQRASRAGCGVAFFYCLFGGRRETRGGAGEDATCGGRDAPPDLGSIASRDQSYDW